MKVLFLTNIPSPYRVFFFDELSKYCDLTVLYESEVEKGRDENWKAKINGNFNSIILKRTTIRNDLVVCPSVTQYLKDKSYDIIVIGGYSTPTGMLAIEYLKYKKIPFLLNADGGFIKEDRFIKHKIKMSFISSASAWLSSGKTNSDYFMHYGANSERIFEYPFTSLTKADILSHTLDSEEKQKIRNKLGIKENKIIITVGRFIPLKRFDVLIKAAQYFTSDVGVYLIGGEATKEYIGIKDKFHLDNVHFVGFKKKNELLEYYKAADIFVMATSSDVWGLVINEAMACGLPIVSTDRCVAGLELVENGENGFILPVGDEKQLADKINIILSNHQLRQKMSEKSLEKIKQYTIENMAERHMEIFSCVLRGDNFR